MVSNLLPAVSFSPPFLYSCQLCLSARASCPLQTQKLPFDAALQDGQDICLSTRAECPLQTQKLPCRMGRMFAFQLVPTAPYKPKSCLSMLPCRMGRMLIRMVCSRDFSLGSNMLPAVSLIWGTIISRCSSCQPTYVLLGLIVCCTILTCMASWLLQPVSMSTDDDLLMQVWAIKPYMSDPVWLCDPGPYPICHTLFGCVTLGHTLCVDPVWLCDPGPHPMC